jgi:hypothetical protein
MSINIDSCVYKDRKVLYKTLADDFKTLWLIVDPFKHQVLGDEYNTDGERQLLNNNTNVYARDMYINTVNHHYGMKISQYLDWLEPKNPMVTVGDFHGRDVMDIFKKYPLISSTNLIKHVEEFNYDNIVYTGFHHGLCINQPPIGSEILGQFAKCYVIQNLVCLLHEGPYNWVQADDRALETAEII